MGTVTFVWLVLTLFITSLLDIPLMDWLALVFTCLVALGIFALLERHRNVRPAELQDLARSLQVNRWLWQRLEEEWVGRTVRLKEDIRNPKEPKGSQVYVQAGTPGKIVALNHDERAPFTVKFPGFGHKVVVRLDKLDVPFDENRAGNVPTKRPASSRARLHGRSEFLFSERHVFDEDEGGIPAEAEAFASETEDFATLDWLLWDHPRARLGYRQKRYRN